MTSRLIALCLFSSVAIVAVPSSAQTIKPGLWEINNTVQSENTQLGLMLAELQKQMASMPPERRQAMEEMLQKNAGVAMPVMKDGGVLVKACISEEMIAQRHMPIQQQGNCTHQRSAMRGNTMKISFSCTNPASSGEGDITFLSDTAYSMKMKINSALTGKQETMSVEAAANWLGTECGSTKPIQIPPVPPKAG